jgi:hypothetical protein
VSAQEWAASATSDADPVTAAAPVFATAMSALAAKATSTVTTLSEPPDPDVPGTKLTRSPECWDPPSSRPGADAWTPSCSSAIALC